MTKSASNLFNRLAGGRGNAAEVAGYDKHRKAMGDKRRTQTLSAQDIGEMPKVKNTARRRKTSRSLKAFCETYAPEVFYLTWSNDHLRVLAKIEHSIRGGECLSIAMPRGSGKSNLCEWAVLWAIITGRHSFAMLVASEGSLAASSMDNIKRHLSSSELLAADYPEVCYPITKLEGEVRRCSGQRYRGEQTLIEWGADQLVLPTIPGSKASGGIVRTAGITSSRIRGARHVMPDGRCVRPSLAIVDDPQTDESARSFLQTGARMKIIRDVIRGLGGPGKSCAVLVPCTVIVPGDLADQLLDRQANPEFRGEKTKALNAFPANMALWKEYASIQKEAFVADRKDHPETEFYKSNRGAMDAGAAVAWPERFDQHQISGLQFCMDKWLANPAGFMAEFQNEPIPEKADDDAIVPAADITKLTNGTPRGVVHIKAQHLTAFVDVHDEILYWAVLGWGEGFTGWIVDYGAWPEQGQPYWQHEKPPTPLWRKYADHGREAQVRQGLMDLTAFLAGRSWPRVDGAEMRITKIGVDTGYKPDEVYDVCRSSPHAAVIQPCRGVGIDAKRRPMNEFARHPGDRLGWHWYLTAPTRGIRCLHTDTNHWKTFMQARWKTAIGDPSSVSLFGTNPREHEFFAEHMAGEVPTRVSANGRSLLEWTPKPSAPVHWLDCVCNCAALAAFLGVTLPGSGEVIKQKKPRIKLSELQRQH